MSQTFKYITSDGDMVDMIANQYYKEVFGATEHIYNTNPGLEQYDSVLPAGLTIFLSGYTPVNIPNNQTSSFWR